MKRSWLLSLLFLGLGILLVSVPRLLQPSSSGVEAVPLVAVATQSASHDANQQGSRQPDFAQAIQFQTYDLPYSLVYVLKVPGNFQVIPAVAETVEPIDSFVQQQGAIGAINGGFFDPVNQQTTSYIVLEAETVADPAQNDRLVNNPDMIPHLDRILNRSEFRQYQCGTDIHYGIAAHNQPAPANCQIKAALGAGPRLLPDLALESEAFVEIVNGELVRDALGSTQPNARSAVAITSEGEIILAMAAQKLEVAGSGLSLTELAEFLSTLGAVEAMNLDGGSSSSLSYQGKTYYGKVDTDGNVVKRSVKSVLLIVEG